MSYKEKIFNGVKIEEKIIEKQDNKEYNVFLWNENDTTELWYVKFMKKHGEHCIFFGHKYNLNWLIYIKKEVNIDNWETFSDIKKDTGVIIGINQFNEIQYNVSIFNHKNGCNGSNDFDFEEIEKMGNDLFEMKYSNKWKSIYEEYSDSIHYLQIYNKCQNINDDIKDYSISSLCKVYSFIKLETIDEIKQFSNNNYNNEYFLLYSDNIEVIGSLKKYIAKNFEDWKIYKNTKENLTYDEKYQQFLEGKLFMPLDEKMQLKGAETNHTTDKKVINSSLPIISIYVISSP